MLDECAKLLLEKKITREEFEELFDGMEISKKRQDRQYYEYKGTIL